MMTHREFTQLSEWEIIAKRLQDLFEYHTRTALMEDKDIGVVRYHRGWLDAINEVLDLPRELLPDPLDDREIEVNEEPGDSFISVKKDGSVY